MDILGTVALGAGLGFLGTVLGSRATLLVPDRWLRSAIALLVAASAVATVAKAS